MDYKLICTFVIIGIMIVMLITDIIISHRLDKTIKEVKESLDAGNILMDKMVTLINNIEEARQEDFKQHIEILSLIRKNTNKKDFPKKDFKKPEDRKSKGFYQNRKPNDNK